jgi:hypothetical protein
MEPMCLKEKLMFVMVNCFEFLVNTLEHTSLPIRILLLRIELTIKHYYLLQLSTNFYSIQT